MALWFFCWSFEIPHNLERNPPFYSVGSFLFFRSTPFEEKLYITGNKKRNDSEEQILFSLRSAALPTFRV